MPGPSELLNQIQSVRWSPFNATSVLLSSTGIQHQFADIALSRDINSVAPHFVRQIHSAIVIEAGIQTRFKAEQRPDADGIFSVNAGQSVAVRTADCLPVLLATKNKSVVCAVHAGWRGFTAGILTEAVKILSRYDRIENILMATGPAISRESFEVGDDVVDALFEDRCGLTPESRMLVVSKGAGTRWHADLPLASACVAINLGLTPGNIEIIQSCTKTARKDGEYLHNSYRRDGKQCGSNWSWISA